MKLSLPFFRPRAATPRGTGRAAADAADTQSQWVLIRRRFSRHRLAVACLWVLAVFYMLGAFCEFFAPYPASWRDLAYAYCPPQPPRFSLHDGLYVFAVSPHKDPVTYKMSFVEDRTRIVRLGFFVRGEPYRLWGCIPATRHFLGVRHPADAAAVAAAPVFYFLGADRYGQDIFSRIVYGARISLSVGFAGIAVTFVLGILVGGVSGYMGGRVDNAIQRFIEIMSSFPHVPLWIGLTAIMPQEWSVLKVYFGITIVLALLSWMGLARVVRGKLLALREEDYAVAARLLGASHARIIFAHLLPGFTSHIIVSLTLSVPGMIIGETSLSFLGLGLKPPVVSWGVMLQDCMNMQALANYPWLLMPVFFIVATVLCFNFVGDGLRDAADPYASR